MIQVAQDSLEFHIQLARVLVYRLERSIAYTVFVYTADHGHVVLCLVLV